MTNGVLTEAREGRAVVEERECRGAHAEAGPAVVDGGQLGLEVAFLNKHRAAFFLPIGEYAKPKG